MVRLPAFLGDVYGDVIAANNIILSFFKVPPEYVEVASQTPGGYNTARFNFGKDLVARSHVLDNWDGYALNSMRSFRENSLRYRAQPYIYPLRRSRSHPLASCFSSNTCPLTKARARSLSNWRNKLARVSYHSHPGR
jgi:hypothetical protein